MESRCDTTMTSSCSSTRGSKLSVHIKMDTVSVLTEPHDDKHRHNTTTRASEETKQKHLTLNQRRLKYDKGIHLGPLRKTLTLSCASKISRTTSGDILETTGHDQKPLRNTRQYNTSPGKFEQLLKEKPRHRARPDVIKSEEPQAEETLLEKARRISYKCLDDSALIDPNLVVNRIRANTIRSPNVVLVVGIGCIQIISFLKADMSELKTNVVFAERASPISRDVLNSNQYCFIIVSTGFSF